MTTNPPRGDLKEGLTSSRPRLSLMPSRATVYAVRALEYGAEKYRRGNYHGAGPEGVSGVERFLGYIDATMRHLSATAQAINEAIGRDEDAGAACRVVDDKPGAKFPASGLPHVAHALASMVIMIEVGIDLGLLEADPGQPWKTQAKPAERAGDDPDAKTLQAVAKLAEQNRVGVETLRAVAMLCEWCGKGARMLGERVCRACVDARAHHNATASGQGICRPAEPCKVPPAGWSCSRQAGHDGPCAARPVGCHCTPGAVCRQCTERARAQLGLGELEDDGDVTAYPPVPR